jgi:hypothetical protein
MKFLKDGSIKMDKELNKLDKFVLDFISILKKHIEYVIISGYVSILFGRSRATEDIDLIVLRMEKKAFLTLFKDLSRRFECLNSSKPEELYNDYLCKNTAIRFSRKGKPIPNIELKFAKTRIDNETLKHKLCVRLGKKEIFISKIELQIAFKQIVLGSDKDLEDAEHLKTVFEKHLNMRKLRYYERMLRK